MQPGPSPPAGVLNGSPTAGGLCGANGGTSSSPDHRGAHHHSVHAGPRGTASSAAPSPGAVGPPGPGVVNPSNGGDLNNNMGGATGLGVPFKNSSSAAVPMSAGSWGYARHPRGPAPARPQWTHAAGNRSRPRASEHSPVVRPPGCSHRLQCATKLTSVSPCISSKKLGSSEQKVTDAQEWYSNFVVDALWI